MALLCSEGGLANIKIDFDRLAKMGGYKNDTTARVIYCKIRRKIEANAAEDPNSGKVTNGGKTPSEPSTPKKPRSPRVTKTPKSGTKANEKKNLKKDDENMSPLKRELFKKELERSVSPSPVKVKVEALKKEMDEILDVKFEPTVKKEEEGSTAFL
ncbi:40S ribosomal protein S22 [Ascosphaera pollenicola]|nr:40S ribosomal protein S22 [Ascosphaera pollenicola]